MMPEERTRYEVLLENIQTGVNVIAEAQGSLSQRMDRMEASFHRLEVKVDVLEIFAADAQRRLKRIDALEVFAADAQRRLKRIESHLQLNGASSRPRARQPSLPGAARSRSTRRAAIRSRSGSDRERPRSARSRR